jgi:hypothetical protein
MAFFRFNRDKRGYEYFYLVEPVTNRRGKTRQRVLYWYRTPPNVRVGRAPFDEEVRRELEAHNPSVAFDWSKIVDAPIPSADAEKWRERRRVEKAEKAARQHAAARASDRVNDEEADVAPPAEEAQPAEAAAAVTRQPYHITADQIRKKRRRRRGRAPSADENAALPENARSSDSVVAESSDNAQSPENARAPEPPVESAPAQQPPPPIDVPPTDTSGE